MATHPTYIPASAEPTNLLITTPPGIGTIAALMFQIFDSPLDYVMIPAHLIDAADIFYQRVDGAFIVDDHIDAVDVLIIDQAAQMSQEMRELVQEALLKRSFRGHKLTNLKHVVLVYQVGDGEPEQEYLELGDQFHAARIDLRDGEQS